MSTPADPEATPNPAPDSGISPPPPDQTAAAAPPPAAAPAVPEEEPLTPELLEDEAIRGDFVLRWLVVLMAVLYSLTQIVETPTLVHVKTGQYLLSHGILPPRTDVFSYTAADRPWINLHWGFDLLVAGLYAVGGWLAVSLLKPIMAAVAFGLAVHTIKPRIPSWWTAICIAAAVVACHKRFTVQPYIITFAGLALVLWHLERWREDLPGSRKLSLWLLVPVFLVWANLDPRMYLGLAALLLWGVGDLLASLFGVSTALSTEDRGHYWKAVGASVAVCLLHPFLWNTLLAPLLVYGAEYAGLHGYVSTLAQAAGADPTRLQSFQPFFSMFDVPLGSYDVASWCGLALIVIALITIALNWFRETGHLVMLIGLSAFPAIAMQDLPAAAFVAAVIAGLNGQAWFAAQFKIDYHISFWNVAFSRGGRAVTVLAIAAVAFFGGTGRLRSTQMGRTGWGLDTTTESTLDALRVQLKDSYDDRPFNMALSQGDILIWLDQKVFADNRPAVYYAPGDKNLLTEHLRTRYALEGRQMPGSKSTARPNWKKTFDAYKLTHVVPRLTGDPEYTLVVRLISGIEPFQATSFGAASLIVYRTDLKDDKLKKYLADHVVDFVKDAYKEEGKEIEPRLQFASPPDFYKRYFWSRRRHIPVEIQEATHLVRLAPLSPQMGDAMALLGIRKSQQGLSKDPDCAEGYLALGKGYATLYRHWEGPLLPQRSEREASSIRYYQAVVALNQALIADPDLAEARLDLIALYLGPVFQQVQAMQGVSNPQAALRPDLALREMKALHAALSAEPEPNLEQRQLRQNLTNQMKPFEEYLRQVKKQLAEVKADDPRQQAQLAMSFAGAGCFDAALNVINADPDPASNPYLNQEGLRARVLLETGDISVAYDLLQEFDSPALTERVHMSRHAAVSKTALADYLLATDILEQSARFVEKQSAMMLLNALKLQPLGETPFPIPAVSNAGSTFYLAPTAMGEFWMDAGLLHLEAGQLKEAEQSLRMSLQMNPDASPNLRALIAHYLTRITGTLDVSPVPRQEEIPILHEDWPGLPE